MKRLLAIVFLFLNQLVFGQHVPRPIIVHDAVLSANSVGGSLAASNAIYSEDFESATSLTAIGMTVSTKASDSGFKLGNAGNANTGQIWKVPSKTKFVYTNDDACNCDKSSDSLFLPTQNLLSSSVYQLRFSAYFNSISIKEKVHVFAKNGGKTILLKTLKSAQAWEDFIVPLYGISGSTEIVFSYDDGGLWSTGLALDNIEICEPNEGVNLGLEFVSINGLNRANAYKAYPAHHAAKLPLKIESKIINLGKYASTNTQVDLSVTGMGTIRKSSTPIVLDPNMDSTVLIHENYIAAKGIGNYEMLFIAKSDTSESETSTDSLKFNLNITDTVISRIGNEDATNGFWFGPNQSFDLSSMVEIKTPDTASSISVFIHNSSTVGAEFDVIILNEFFQDNVVPQVFPPVGTELKVTQENKGKWNTFKIPSTYLNTGIYYVGIRTRGDKVLVGVSDEKANPGVSYINIGTGYAPSNSLPYVRLNVKPRSCSLSATTITKKSICNGATGAATVNASQGLMPYYYQWTSNVGGSTSNAVTNLSSDYYEVTVSDSLGCSVVLPVSISDTNSPLIAMKNITNENCFGDLTGSIELGSLSGLAPFVFRWSNGLQDSTIQNLGSGSYTVTLTDNSGSGCKTIGNYTISGPNTPLSVEFVVKNNICFNDTMGSIRANVKGGVPTYKYDWADTSIKKNVNKGLISGMYLVTITDTNNCTLVDSAEVKGSTPIVVKHTVLDNINIGKIQADVSGGKEPLTFTWSGPDGFRNPGTKDLEDLILRGIYTLIVTDDLGCEVSVSSDLSGIVGTLEHTKNVGFKLFPNPSKDVVYLHLGDNVSGQYAIFNLTGTLIDEKQFYEQSVILLEKLNSGIYILDVKTRETQVSYKLIFQD